MTPRRRSTSVSDASLLRAPRSLNEFVTCRFSYLTNTSAPVSADRLRAGSMGVRSTAPELVPRADSISARVMLIQPRQASPLALLQHRPVAPHLRTSPRLPCASLLHLPCWPLREKSNHERRRTEAGRLLARREAA